MDHDSIILTSVENANEQELEEISNFLNRKFPWKNIVTCADDIHMMEIENFDAFAEEVADRIIMKVEERRGIQ